MKAITAVVVALALFAGCGDNRRIEPPSEDSVATPPQSQTVTVTPAPKEWVAERYGVKSGVVELTSIEELLPGQDTTGTGGTGHRIAWYTRYFDDFGARTAEYQYSDSARTTLVRTSIDDNGIALLYMQGDTVARRIGWPRFMLPNFNRLTDEMRTSYNITQIDGRTVLGKECTGYALLKNDTKSTIWTWQGIFLYGEVGVDRSTKPTILQATSLQTDVPVPPEKFQLPAGVPVIDMDVSSAM
jgi:hypothetical protein